MITTKNLGIKKRSAAMKIIGPDSYRFLNGMLTQDIQKTHEQIPSGGRSLFLTPKGKLIVPLYFASLSKDSLLIWTEDKLGETLKTSLEKYLIADKVEIQSLGSFDSWSLSQSEFSGQSIKTRHPLGLEKLFPLQIQNDTYILPQQMISPTHCEVLSLNGSFSAAEQSPEDFWELSCRAGHPVWNIDLFPEDFALEFPLADAVSFDKGCYIGQETVARGTFRGKVNKVFSRMSSTKPLKTGELFTLDGEKIGEIRHCYKNLASGLVKLSNDTVHRFKLNNEEIELQIEYLVGDSSYRKGR